MKNKKGFTLAEVLVTMGVIGVVAALTVPNLVKDYQKKSLIAQLRKVHSELQQVFLSYMSDERVESLRETPLFGANAQTDVNGLTNFYKQYFKSPTIVGAAPTAFAPEYGFLSGAATDNVGSVLTQNYRAAILPSGAVIATVSGRGSTLCEAWNNVTCKEIYVDINGKQPPNIWGRDLFILFVTDSGNVTGFQMDADSADGNFEGACKVQTSGGFKTGSGCFGKILNDNWEMNY